MDRFVFYMLTSSWTNIICWKGYLFFPLDGCSSFVKDQVTIGVWVHFWVFYSILLIYLPVTVPIPFTFWHYYSVVQLDIRDGSWHQNFPRNSFIDEHSSCYPVFLLFQINLRIALTLWRIESEFLMGIAVDCFRQGVHFLLH